MGSEFQRVVKAKEYFNRFRRLRTGKRQVLKIKRASVYYFIQRILGMHKFWRGLPSA